MIKITVNKDKKYSIGDGVKPSDRKQFDYISIDGKQKKFKIKGV